MKSRMNVGSKDLTNANYDKKMMLLFNLRYGFNDVFEDGRDLHGLIRHDNVYVLPKEVKYTDYINSGYEALVMTKLRKDEKIHKTVEELRQHTLIEVEVKNLNSVIRGLKISNSLVCFAAIEPLQKKDSLRSYV